MDSKELRGLFEAYGAVYNPELRQEVGEQQDFENWVNSLVEEGYDLSEYTMEEMYEEYLNEMGQKGGGRVTGSNPNVYKPTPTTSGPAGGGMNGMRGSGRDRNATQTSSSPGALRVKPSAATPTAKPAPAAAKPSPAAKPAASGGTRPAALPSASKVEPAKPAPGTKAAGPASIKPKTPNPLLAGGDIRRMQQASQMRQKNINVTSDQLKAAERTKPTEVKKESFDLFDVVKGHLIGEGYADTEEAALVIMANMSEGWRESIISEAVKGESPERRKALAAERKSGVKPLSAKEGEKYASHKLSQMSYSKRRRMGDAD